MSYNILLRLSSDGSLSSTYPDHNGLDVPFVEVVSAQLLGILRGSSNTKQTSQSFTEDLTNQYRELVRTPRQLLDIPQYLRKVSENWAHIPD